MMTIGLRTSVVYCCARRAGRLRLPLPLYRMADEEQLPASPAAATDRALAAALVGVPVDLMGLG